MSTASWITVFACLFWHIRLHVEASSTSGALTRKYEGFSWQTWGPYRPNLYFGVRPQVPETLLMGLMWAGGEDRETMLKTLRDTCEQDDGMQGYGWTAYDSRLGGSQTIHDTELLIDLTTDFVKSSDGNSWASRVSGTPRSNAPHDLTTTVVLHFAIEKAELGDERRLVCGHRGETPRSSHDVQIECRGNVPGLGEFEIRTIGDVKNKPMHDTIIKSLQVPEHKIWQAKDVFTDQLAASDGDGVTVDHGPGVGNMHFLQMTFEGAFNVTLTYNSLGAAAIDDEADGLVAQRDSFHSAFPSDVDKVFLQADPFKHGKYGDFSQALLSNLLGGLGFFHGDSKVDYSDAPEYEETDLMFWKKAAVAMARANITTTSQKSLLTFTPSRPFFPRGFLWDEGFHLLPVVEWDLDLAVSVLRSWLQLMDDDGWIGREQILGPEARSRVPEQFKVQYPHYANPPTLILLLPVLISKIAGTSAYAGHNSTYVASPADASLMLKEIYPLLSRQYRWFRRTQAGNFSSDYPRPDGAVAGEGYRWRGRTPMHTLTSGLDDYPRANPPHPAELHVDALAWVAASARALQQVAEYLGEDADAAIYEGHLSAAKHNLDVLHWDDERRTYCDATVEGGIYTRVCHQGYVSLFPLLLGLLDLDSPSLPHVLELISDPTKLSSPYGLRSLSAADAYYGKDEDYWRGAVWVHLNVLATLRLQELGMQEQARGDHSTSVQTRAMSIAAKLRERLVCTVYNSWVDTGFVWEQYDDKTGKGRGSRAFTGWTACVILLMGLDLAGHSGGRRGDPCARRSSPSAPIVFLLALVVVLLVVFRRRVMGLVAHFTTRFHAWRLKRKPGQAYEQVVDLDDHEP